MINNQMAYNNYREKVFAVYYDCSSRDDIPWFLNVRPHALPSEIQELCLALINVNPRPITDCVQYSFDQTFEFQSKIAKLRAAIANIGKNHYKKNTVL